MENKYEWNLSKLYTDFESPKFKEDLAKFEFIINDIIKFSEKELSNGDNAIEKIEKYINLQNTLGNVVTSLSSFANLTLATDSKNSKALKIADI